MTDDQPDMKCLARSFGGVADAYDRGRPSYPAEAVAWLLDGDARIVLELGAGTGKLTREVVDQGHAVFATEKDPAMLSVLEQRVPEVSAKVAVAEEIPANDRSVDVVIAAQAFHWFDHDVAVPEMARVLKPGGRLVVLEFSKVWKPLERAYDWYSFKVLPWLGDKVAGDAEAYRYLADSIRMHPDQAALATMLREAGFSEVEVFNLAAGVVAVHRGMRF